MLFVLKSTKIVFVLKDNAVLSNTVVLKDSTKQK